MQLLNAAEAAQQRVHRDMRATVMASMETGQHSRARTAIREYAEEFPDKARALRTDVLVSYGVAL